jgi:hypothetical protein
MGSVSTTCRVGSSAPKGDGDATGICRLLGCLSQGADNLEERVGIMGVVLAATGVYFIFRGPPWSSILSDHSSSVTESIFATI